MAEEGEERPYGTGSERRGPKGLFQINSLCGDKQSFFCFALVVAGCLLDCGLFVATTFCLVRVEIVLACKAAWCPNCSFLWGHANTNFKCREWQYYQAKRQSSRRVPRNPDYFEVTFSQVRMLQQRTPHITSSLLHSASTMAACGVSQMMRWLCSHRASSQNDRHTRRRIRMQQSASSETSTSRTRATAHPQTHACAFSFLD